MCFGSEQTAAASDERAVACADAFERAQLSAREGKLLDARSDAASCSDHTCPDFLENKCVRLGEKIAGAVPSIVVRDSTGEQLREVRVFVDGQLVSEQLHGAPIELDPGEHLVRIESASGRASKHRVVLAPGERNRVVDVHLPRPRPIPPKPRGPALARAAAAKTDGHLVPALVLGGVGLSLVGVGIGLGIHALKRDAQAEDLCPDKLCALGNEEDAQALVDEARITGGVGIASLLVGAAGVTAGAVLLAMPIEDEGHRERSLRLRVGPSGLSLYGTF